MTVGVDAPPLSAAFMDHCMLGNVLECTGYSTFLNGFQGTNALSNDHGICSILWRDPAFVHDSGLVPVVVFWVCPIGRVAEGHEAMGVLVAPMMGIVQWPDVLVSKDATDTIWSGPMDEMHFAGMAAFTTELWLIG